MIRRQNGSSLILSKEETIKLIPNVNKKGLRGGVIYHDGQFDDTRMAISLALTANDHNACLINYCEVVSLIKKDDLVTGIEFKDTLINKTYKVNSKVVINATGVFADKIIKLDQPNSKKMIKPSQGVHIVLEKKFLDSPHAIMIPHTTDGRVLFAVPWKDYVVLGTTDTQIKDTLDEPKPLKEEINFIINNASKYMSIKPSKKDIKSVFTGLRPLAATSNKKSTKEVSRSHKINISTTGLISILGGKWTTYRKIAEDSVDASIPLGGLRKRNCKTKKLRIHGFKRKVDWDDPLHVYGSDARKLKSYGSLMDNKSLSKKIFISNSIIYWSVTKEMAMTVEDVLARRTRCLFLDSAESVRIAPQVANKMAEIMEKDKAWVDKELKKFNKLSKNYKA